MPFHFFSSLTRCSLACLTYLLHGAECRVLLEKLTGLQLVKKFPAFHGTQRFITALTSVRHLSLSWARPIQSIYPHPTSWRSILILFSCSLPILNIGVYGFKYVSTPTYVCTTVCFYYPYTCNYFSLIFQNSLSI